MRFARVQTQSKNERIQCESINTQSIKQDIKIYLDGRNACSKALCIKPELLHTEDFCCFQQAFMHEGKIYTFRKR